MIIKKKYSLGLLLLSSLFSSNIIAEEPKKGGALIYLCGEEGGLPVGTATLVEKNSGEGVKQVDVNLRQLEANNPPTLLAFLSVFDLVASVA